MTKWNLTDYFKTEEDFYTTRERCLNQAKNIGKYRSDILNNINALLEEYEQLNDDFSSVYTYASQKYHLNMKDSKNIEDYSQTMNVANEIDGLTSWLNPEFVKLEKSDILNELTEENKLRYAYTLERTFNSKKYFLSASEENIIVNLEKAKKSVVDSYQALTISDNSPAKVEINGEEVLVTAANYSKLLTELESQEDRKNVFEAYFKFYEEHSTTLACMYNNVLSINSSIAKLRGFNSSIEAQLHKNNIPVEIYTTLVASVKENTLFLKEFLNFRKEELGLETIHTYDRMRKVYSSSKQYPYEEG